MITSHITNGLDYPPKAPNADVDISIPALLQSSAD